MPFLVLQEVEPDDLLIARHVVGQVDQPYHRRHPCQPHRPMYSLFIMFSMKPMIGVLGVSICTDEMQLYGI